MKIEANAKVNLTLDVVRRREDGYHELDMIMVPLTLCDYLDVTFSEKDEILCDEQEFPLDETNTIYKAMHLVREYFKLDQHFKVVVDKRIPMQAGLAGGSADGAATIKAILQLCNLEMKEDELLALGKKIGADVPFCLVNEASRVKGIGEKIERFKIECPFHMLLVKPEQGVSTKEAFQGIDFNTCIHPDVDTSVEALKQGDYETFCTSIGNTLEQSAFVITPIIQTIKQELNDYGFDAVLMSGSGSTVFALTRNKEVLDKAKEDMKDKYTFVCECSIL